ncbi:MAG: tetratricopeptide repeat protein [Deltaproteobacteria bacterium]|nr:tetratricopeptide repeat protein [Deltaproteobacteria bacterium]
MGYYSRGMAFQGKGDFDQAMMGYYSRGMAFRNKGDFDRAISDFGKVIDLSPMEATGYYSRGMAFRGKSDFDQAISDFSKAIALNPREAKFYNNRGTAWQRKGDYKRAVADYAKALEVETDCKAEAVPKADTRGTLDRKKVVTPVGGEKRIRGPKTIKVPTGNIRAKPTTSSAVIAKLGRGTVVTIIHQEGKWYAVKFSGDRLGWAHEVLFEKSQ